MLLVAVVERGGQMKAVFIAVCFTMVLACSPSANTLKLTEVEVRQIPASLALSGVHARGSTSVLWSSNPPSVIIQTRGRAIPVGEDRLLRPVAAAVLDNGNTIEVLDVLRRSIITYRASGLIVSEQSVLLPFVPLTAARGSSGWFVAGLTAGDTVGVAYVGNEPNAVRFVRALPPRSDGRQRLGTLEAMEPGVVYAEMASPFPVHIIGWESSVELRPPLPDAVTVPTGATADSAVWVALRAVPIDTVLLQTLADLRSTHRILRIFTRAGLELSVSELDAPIGVAGIDNESNRLFAVRRLNRQEVVFYNWKWGAGSYSSLKGG